MGNKEPWTDTVTSGLKSAIQQAALASYANACDLMNDAKILRQEDRYARAGALVILSEEEFSKAFILLVCAQQNRWDSVIFDALRRHPKKQGIASGMREYFEWFVDNYSRVVEMNRFSLVPMTPAIMPDQKRWEELVTNASKAIKSEKKERYKQSVLYVGFDRKAKVTSDPRKADKIKVEDCFKEAEKFKEVVEIALSEQIPGFSKIVI
jgi:AbiV family abortive infection protein